MSPEMLIQNASALVQALLPFAATLALLVGTLVYGYGKASDSPNACRWGKNGWLGGGVMFAGSAVIGLVQHIATRLTTSGPIGPVGP